MNRRHFATSFAAGFAGFAAATERGKAAGDTGRNRVYLLESFRLQQGTQRGRLDEFFTGALLPALERIKTQSLVMEAVIGPHTPEVLSVLGCSGLAELAEMRAKLAADPAVTKALAKYESGPEPPYESQQITLLEAESYSPASLPEAAAGTKTSSRYYELRVYHNSSRAILRSLHERFAGPETRIFARSGIHPVLYGTTIIGGDMPNLTYLIPFESLAAREKAWDTFNADPEWVKVRAESNQNGQLVSIANVSIYKAVAYSPVK